MNDLVFVVSQKKKWYQPIADAVRKASKEMGFGFHDLSEDLRGYKYIIVFDSKFRKPVRCDSDAKVGWWMNDPLRPKELHYQYIRDHIRDHVAYIFLCNKEYKKLYEKTFNLPVYYMPQCGLEFKEIKKREINWNILFIGRIKKDIHGIHANREWLLNEFSKYNLKQISNEKTTWDQRYLYHYTPINLAISISAEEYTSNRLYNILASQGFCLSLYFPGIEKLFINGKHLVWFKTPQEGRKLIDYYINHPKERKQITENGYQLFLEKHRAKHRIQNMYDIMSGKTSKFYGYL